MGESPIHETVRPTCFSVRDFVTAGAARLRMAVMVEEGLDHVVDEPMCNRPGLALTGFYRHFAWRRLQVIGNSEREYLMSLSETDRRSRLQSLFDRQAYCLIFTCGMVPPAEAVAIARAAGGVLLMTELSTREFFHQATFVLETLGAPKAKLYATTVEVAGLGVMMEGAPGLGKSETALGLVKHGNALVADDLTCLRKDVAENVLYASAAETTRNYMEIRGIGIIHVPSIFGVTAVRGEKQLDLVITFRRIEEVSGDLDRVGEDRNVRSILGVDVPQVVIPVSAGRDLVNLVETAAQQQKLRMAGHDAVRELDERLRAHAAAKGNFKK